MFNRLQLAIPLFFLVALLSLPSAAAETPDVERELHEINSLPDKQAMIKRLDSYLLTHPKSARVVGFRAEVNNCLGDSQATIRDATRYFELNKGRALPVIHKVRAHAYIKTREFAKAINDLDAARKLDDKDGDTVYMRALALESLGRLAEAKAEYGRAIALGCEKAHLNKGCLEYRINQRDEGTADCVAYIRSSKDPTAQEALAATVTKIGNENLLALYDGLIAAKLAKQFVYVHRAELLFALCQYARAERELEYCEQKFGKNLADARIQSYWHLQEYDKAVVLVSKLIAQSPKKLSLYILRAESYLGLKNFELALADYNHADVLVLKDLDALRKRGECNFRLGHYEKAEADFAKGNSQGASVKSLTFEGLNFKALKKYQEGVDCFTRAMKLQPLSTNLFTSRADCYFRLGDYPNCDHDLCDAITLDNKNPTYYFARGSCRLAAGNAEAAVKDLTVALSEKNLHSVAYTVRAKAYTKLGKSDLAAKDMRAAGSASKALEVDLFKQ